MPGNFRSAIFIFQNRLTAYRFRIKKKQAILQDQQEYSFVQQNLPQVFSKLKKSFHTNKFYLLLPETHTYLKLLEFPASTKLDRSLVLQKAQETIPEQIQEGYYDWKQFPLAKDESQLKVQFIAVSTDYLLPLQKAATQAGLSFPALEPLSLALARLHQYEPKPQLISHEGAEGTTLLISHQSRVFASTVFSDLSQKNQEKV